MNGMQNIINYNQLGKSRGIVLFAYNTKFNYVNIATQSAKIAKLHLNLPVTLITDQNIDNDLFDNIIIDTNQFENFRSEGTIWRNGNRHRAYELSPYDETLLIDSDYIILDKKLLELFNVTQDYRIFQSTNFLDINTHNKMGHLKLDFLWATALIFKKTLKTKLLFELVKNIQNNYQYYYDLYQIPDSNFRNDYAFTIADYILNGYGYDKNCYIPWPLISINELETLELYKNSLVIKNKNNSIISPIQSLHILDKAFLLSDKFTNFLSNYEL